MDGLNFKLVGNPVADNFQFDEFGSLIPDRSHLQMERTAKELARQLKSDTGLYRRMTEMYFRTDVLFTDNPYGNTPTIGAGIRKFGKRPLNVKFREKRDKSSAVTGAIAKQLDKRQRKIVENQKKIMALHKELEPADKESSEYLQWLVEGDQAMTGGGFDGNSIGEVTKSALNFVIKSNEPLEYSGSQFSKLVVEGSHWLKEKLMGWGLQLGSLSPIGAHQVRLDQESDGMIGYPVYAKAFAECDRDIATRLLLYCGVDTRKFVGTTVKDERTGTPVKYRVIDAIAYCLDNMVTSAETMPADITLLARIQKHAWKVENGEVVPSKPKTRSVYPNSAIPGMLEAMIFTPFLTELQRLQVPIMPSLQDKPTRVAIIKRLIEQAMSEGYDYLAADWSKWDATVKGHILATVIYYAIRPFYRSQWQGWVDLAIYTLTYKYILCDSDLCRVNPDMYQDARNSGPWVEVKPFTIFGLIDGLISGAKLTHVGGSLYGEVVIHYVIARLMGYEPIPGPQAGDDTLMGIPISMININSCEETYKPIEKWAKAIGLDMNASKQIWHNVKGEVVKVFLQDVYHANTNTWGTGSIFRPYDAVFFSEREKGLCVGEQLMAEIARMNQGSDCAFVEPAVESWLNDEPVLGSLFKEYGVSAFEVIIESVQQSVREIAERIDVGSFTWSVSREDLEKGTLPILAIMAKVSSRGEYNMTVAQALKILGSKGPTGGSDTPDETSDQSDDLTSEEEVVLAD